jgi:selenocysteine lyase/cysteine desulfurase
VVVFRNIHNSRLALRGRLDVMITVKIEQIYLDFNATTPIAAEVAAAITGSLAEPFGNPSSGHWAGLPAHAAVENAREQVSRLLHLLT